MLEFGFFIILNDVSEQDKVKAFVKEYYSCFDCIRETAPCSLPTATATTVNG